MSELATCMNLTNLANARYYMHVVLSQGRKTMVLFISWSNKCVSQVRNNNDLTLGKDCV